MLLDRCRLIRSLNLEVCNVCTFLLGLSLCHLSTSLSVRSYGRHGQLLHKLHHDTRLVDACSLHPPARPGVLIHSLGATFVHQRLNQPCVRLMGTICCRHDAAPDAGNWEGQSLRK